MLRAACLLSALTAAAAAQPTPRTGLNHFYHVPDSATFAAIESSRFLRDTLGVFEARTTRRSDQVYTGVYWYGQATYFEFLPPGPGNRKPGDSGMAWGTDAADDSAMVRRALSGIAGERVTSTMITRGIDSVQVPWFLQTALESGGRTRELNSWVMTYAGDFLTRWHGTLPPVTGGSSRSAVLERYAAKVGQLDRRRDAAFTDVTGLDLQVDAATRTRVLAECRALGGMARGSRCTLGDFALRLNDATPTARGLRRIVLRLRHPWSGPRVRTFGTSTLRLIDDATAEWEFGTVLAR
ncbi:MAG: DUF5829 family protein [Gemmatimonadaceae bacterium]|nr:DUF5829 family protein [Gemmatimonadaceae bacterium]